MIVTIQVRSMFGTTEEKATVNNSQELEDLKRKWSKYPQDTHYSTSVYLTSEGYCEQVL